MTFILSRYFFGNLGVFKILAHNSTQLSYLDYYLNLLFVLLVEGGGGK